MRIDQIFAQIPVRTANNTPVGDLIGQTANAPQGLNPENSALAEEPAGTPVGPLQPPPAFVLAPDTLVRAEDLTTSAACFSNFRSMFWSLEMLWSLLAVVLL
jgi:hypothetical protein